VFEGMRQSNFRLSHRMTGMPARNISSMIA